MVPETVGPSLAVRRAARKGWNWARKALSFNLPGSAKEQDDGAAGRRAAFFELDSKTAWR